MKKTRLVWYNGGSKRLKSSFWGGVSIILSTPGFSAVSGGSISREDDGSFWQPVSSLLHDLAGPIRASRHPIPCVAAEEQEGEGRVGVKWSLGGQRSSQGAEGFSSSSSSHSSCLFSQVSWEDNLDFFVFLAFFVVLVWLGSAFSGWTSTSS